ncbi:hypothetical protein SF23_14120 [Streptomyces sp. MBRL 10]|nr:hypothetical protein SF23_14120 [Streptomyces sp. MBRL 10]
MELLTDEDPGVRRAAAERARNLLTDPWPPALPLLDPEVGVLLDRCTGLVGENVMRNLRRALLVPDDGSGPGR